MHSTNPKYVLRNYLAQLAIDEAGVVHHKAWGSLWSLRPLADVAIATEVARHPLGGSGGGAEADFGGFI